MILSPDDLATVTSPVMIQVEARGEAQTTVDEGGQLVAFVDEDCPESGAAIDGAPMVMTDGSIELTLTAGVHTVCIQTLDAAGQAAWAIDERTLTVE